MQLKLLVVVVVDEVIWLDWQRHMEAYWKESVFEKIPFVQVIEAQLMLTLVFQRAMVSTLAYSQDQCYDLLMNYYGFFHYDDGASENVDDDYYLKYYYYYDDGDGDDLNLFSSIVAYSNVYYFGDDHVYYVDEIMMTTTTTMMIV